MNCRNCQKPTDRTYKHGLRVEYPETDRLPYCDEHCRYQHYFRLHPVLSYEQIQAGEKPPAQQQQELFL